MNIISSFERPLSDGRGLRMVIVTDAAPPQVNGVVRTLGKLGEELKRLGHEVHYITPDQFHTIPLPSYKEIRVALFPKKRITRMLDSLKPDVIHIATEGPLGLAARKYCLECQLPFTTSFHTRFPEYLYARTRIPMSWTYALVRRFHAPAFSVMAATPLLKSELEDRGFRNVKIWSRGVDTDLFHPRDPATNENQLSDSEPPRPHWLYVGRVAVEKNIDAFLDLDLPGTKIIVGDGPRLEHLKKKFPKAIFKGGLYGQDLAQTYAAADCFVFPSKTDTFGLVLIEALASGIPVAAYPVQGPLDVIGDAPVGKLHHDLKTACLEALKADRQACLAYAAKFSWTACTEQFLSNLPATPKLEPASLTQTSPHHETV